ncbi:MAG: carbohydrate-binding domain-containing protein [Firmicutes bacterium]|nr:carbohydrate-binding domain-containing protein [Bacillota bacterium]
MKKSKRRIALLAMTALMMLSLAACGAAAEENSSAYASETKQEATAPSGSGETVDEEAQTVAETETSEAEAVAAEDQTIVITTAAVTADGVIDATDLFSKRDLTQTADLSEAEYWTVQDGQDLTVSSAGVYVIAGNAKNVTIRVEAGDEDKVQIVLDGVSIVNETSPCIYVVNADKVFVTTTDSENSLTVSGSFTNDGDTNTDAVIFAKDDLVLNGLGNLTVNSTENGISCKDDLKITGGVLTINSQADAVEANDSILIADGTITIVSYKDGFHAENDEDLSTGYIYLCGGSLNIQAADDGIHATTVFQMDGGQVELVAAEGIEATYIQINDGEINMDAYDDGINAAYKSDSYYPTAEFNGGSITINMGQGDTDAVDSNGYLIVNGGTLNLNAQSPFDYDRGAEYNGGTIIVNGVETNNITNQMMGGGMMGGHQGGQQGGHGPH